MQTPIPTALLAYGLSGRIFHAPFLIQSSDFQWVGALERQRKTLRETHPQKRSYGSFEEVLQDQAVALVVVNTPTAVHAEQVAACLNAGKHVLVEKASVPSSAVLAELLALAEARGLVLTVYQNRRLDSDFLAVRKALESGKLGSVYRAEFRMERFKPALSVKAHKELPGPGAGLLWDLGPHLFDQALLLFGVPQAVQATARYCRPDTQLPDDYTIHWQYPEQEVWLHLSLYRAPVLPAFTIFGTEGVLVQPRSDAQEDLLQAGVQPIGADWARPGGEAAGRIHQPSGQVEILPIESGNYGLYYAQLAAAIRGTGSLPVTGTEAVQLIRLLELTDQSVRQDGTMLAVEF